MKILKYFAFALLFAGLAAGSAFAAMAEYNEGEVIAVMKAPQGEYGAMSVSAYATMLEARALSFAQRTNLSAVSTYAALSQSSGSDIVFFKAEGKTTAQLIEELKDDPEILSVSPNYKRTLDGSERETYSVPDDPSVSKQWGLNRINIFDVWSTYSLKPGETVYVAVVDTGVDYNHDDLRDNIAKDASGRVIGKAFYGNGVHESDDPIDKNVNGGHGTHVSGIIGAVGNNRTGIAGVHYKNVKIIPVNVFTGDGPLDGCWDADIIKGLDYVLEQKRNGLNVRVVNMSLGGWSVPDTQSRDALQTAIQQLSDEGIIITISAGNDGANIPSEGENGQIVYPFPASYWMIPNKITVGSISPVSFDKSDFSNFDSGGESVYKPDPNIRFVDMAAPGEFILSTIPGNGYAYFDGTSMAAPFVAGTAALLFSMFPEKSAAEIKACILDNTFSGTGEGSYWAHGSLNVGKAYLQFDSGAAGITPDPTLEQQPPVVLELTCARGDFTVVVDNTVQLYVSPETPGVWNSRNNTVAVIDPVTGVLTGMKTGRAEIVFTPYYSRGVTGGVATIEVLNIYDQGNLGSGCSAVALPALAFPVAFLVFIAYRKRKK